ncbi:uncharacterized protein [Pithys albifrons albifrons]|uniref:uncharacterized protein n=1 Tax=Pithys albifrons albifrons TaxID=3385563 RepID=UPI003A5D0A7B
MLSSCDGFPYSFHSSCGAQCTHRRAARVTGGRGSAFPEPPGQGWAGPRSPSRSAPAPGGGTRWRRRGASAGPRRERLRRRRRECQECRECWECPAATLACQCRIREVAELQKGQHAPCLQQRCSDTETLGANRERMMLWYTEGLYQDLCYGNRHAVDLLPAGRTAQAGALHTTAAKKQKLKQKLQFHPRQHQERMGFVTAALNQD